MNALERTRCYLVGHMQYSNGEAWRSDMQVFLKKRNVIVFNPYEKPFLKDVEEGDAFRGELAENMKQGNYDKVSEKMRQIRIYDLNLVDRSDFIVAHIIPNVASWGSAEELVTAVRMKKPTFLSIEGGKSKAPLWLLGMFPHKYFYNNLEEVKEMIAQIDDGDKKIDSDRWRLLRKDQR